MIRVSINKKEKSFLIIGASLCGLSLLYIIAYNLYLRSIDYTNFTLTYLKFYIFLARPIFYISLSTIITKSILLITKYNLPVNFKKYFAYLFNLILLFYVALLLLFFLTVIPEPIYLVVTFILFDSSILFILLGFLLSLIIQTKKENV